MVSCLKKKKYDRVIVLTTVPAIALGGYRKVFFSLSIRKVFSSKYRTPPINPILMTCFWARLAGWDSGS